MNDASAYESAISAHAWFLWFQVLLDELEAVDASMTAVSMRLARKMALIAKRDPSALSSLSASRGPMRPLGHTSTCVDDAETLSALSQEQLTARTISERSVSANRSNGQRIAHRGCSLWAERHRPTAN